jgi:hypothetical protein
MRWKLFVELCLTILVFWIIAGDLFLPQPYRSVSQQLRTNINYFIVGLLPRKSIININFE